ncbi:hypothetical protein TYRP_008111 [Tyrophagus putrescentiae]|nr:hypothetical protein TYRP_008111 [Tyrophagus putrescentiae]
MRIYSEESVKRSAPVKSPLSPTSSTSSSSNCSSSFANGTLSQSTVDLESYNSSSSSSQISRVSIPQMFNKQSRPAISMYKFISSKGKQMIKESNGVSASLGSSHFLADTGELSEPKLPRYVATNHNFYRKRLSAIDKIQEELKEMKQREDELRCQRVRAIGLSYPNLNSICDEDFTSDDQTIESSEENKDSFHSRCSSSNPDLSINTREAIEAAADDSDGSQSLQVGGPRRKIPLIALWEQRIQEVVEKK